MASGILRPSKRKHTLIRDLELRRQRREAVAAAAFDLFLKDGFHRTSARDIARQAGISIGAVFSYFRDKEEILFHILDQEQGKTKRQIVETLEGLLRDGVGTHADPEMIFTQAFTHYLRSIDEMRRFILLGYQETKSLNQQARNSIFAREKRVWAALAAVLRYGAERGCFTSDNIELKAHNIMVLAHAWAIRRWAFAGVADSIEDYIAFLQPLTLAMLKTPGVEAMVPLKRGQADSARPAIVH